MNRRRIMLMNGQEENEMKEWKTIERRVLEEDTKSISIDIPNAKEVMLVFFGRENSLEDNKANGSGSDGLGINGNIVSNAMLTYIRPHGVNFHTIVYAKVINGYIDGTISPKGSNVISGFSNIITNADYIRNIYLVTNNYFKKESWVETYYR